MRRKSLVVFSLLLVASLMAAIGTGAIDVFSATRAADMEVVTDAQGIIGLSSNSGYTLLDKYGSLKLDFTGTNGKFIGQGFNPRALFEFNDVFTVTNQSPDTVYVWLEAEGWDSWHNAGLKYVIGDTYGAVEITKGIDTYKTNTLLTTTGWNFKSGVGSLAYVKLAPGASFDVNINVNTNLENGYGTAGKSWDHKVIVKANENPPTRP